MIDNGNVILSNKQTLGTLNGNGVLNLGGDLTVSGGSFSGSINDGGAGYSVTLSTSATLTLSGANNFSGGVFLNAGTIAIKADNNLSAANGALTFNGGTLAINAATFSSSRTINVLGGKTARIALGNGTVATLASQIAGAGSLTVFSSTGRTNSILVLTGNNSYHGVIIQSGTLVATTTNSLGAVGALTLSPFAGTSAALVLNANATVSLLTGTNGSNVTETITLNGTILTVNQFATSTYVGVMSGTGSLIKSGTGTLNLSGLNSFTGGTTINAGTMTVSVSGSLAGGRRH